MKSPLRFLAHLIAPTHMQVGGVSPAHITLHTTAASVASHARLAPEHPEIPEHVGLELKEPRELGWRAKS